jgi:hypothetical protein
VPTGVVTGTEVLDRAENGNHSPRRYSMTVRARDVAEAEDLLMEVQSWPEEAVDRLPKFYREKARQYRQLVNSGED